MAEAKLLACSLARLEMAALMAVACVGGVEIQAQRMAMAASLGAVPASQRLLREPAVETAHWAHAHASQT